MKVKVNGAKKAMILDAFRNGASFGEVAATSACNFWTIGSVCPAAVISSLRNIVAADPERVARIRELAAAGQTYSQIAADLGCTRSAVAGICNRQGIKMVPRAARAPKRRPASKPTVIKPVARRPVSKPVAVERSVPVIVREAQPATSLRFPSERPGCRWPLWTDTTPIDELHVCGGQISVGWTCAFHARLAYRTPDRRAA